VSSLVDPAIKAATIATGARPTGADPASTIAPAANASGQGGNAASPRLPAGAVALAASLSGLAEGGLLEALVLGRDREGGAVLRTPNGTFVATPPAGQPTSQALLPAQVKALLEIVTVGDLVQSRLIAVDARPLAAPLPLTLRLTALAQRSPDAKAPTGERTPAEASDRPARAAAVPLPPVPPSTATPIRSGQTLLSVLQVPPHSGPPEAPRAGLTPAATAGPTTLAGAGREAPAPAAFPAALPIAPTAAPVPALPQGSLVSVRVLATTPPGAPPPIDPLPAGAFAGEVAIEGDPEHQRPVLRLPGGNLRLPPTATAPAGTRLVIEFLASAPATSTGRDPEAERLVKQLETAVLIQSPPDPAAAARVAAQLTDRVPAPGRKLTAAALLFLAAARHGDLGGWLEAGATQPGRPETEEPLKRLASAWRNHLGEDTDRSASEAWRSLVVPFHDGVTLRPLVFHLRRRAPRPETAGDTGETRFLLDLDLTALGALQLDGLIRPKRFDLMLRGAGRLDRGMRHELSLLFQESLGALGYAGALAFRDERPTAHVGAAHVEARA